MKINNNCQLYMTKINDNQWVKGIISGLRTWNDQEIRSYSFIEILDGGTREYLDVWADKVFKLSDFKDMNNIEIFEGCILGCNIDGYDCHALVKFGNYKQDGSAGEYNPVDCCGWYVEVNNFTCPDYDDDPSHFPEFKVQMSLAALCNDPDYEVEVIGNIIDNPDLLS